MSLFRKRCDQDAAIRLLLSIVTPRPDGALVSYVRKLAEDDSHHDASGDDEYWSERIHREFCVLRLLGVLVSTAISSYVDWQSQGECLYEQLCEKALLSTLAEHESDVLVRRWFAERLQYYSLLQHVADSRGALISRVGNSFSVLFGESCPNGLSLLGAGIFSRAMEQSEKIHGDYKLS